MKTLTIGFSHSKSKLAILSTIIRKIEKTKFSHVFFKMENDSLRNALFYHASGSKVNFMGTELFFKKNEVVKSFEYEVSEGTFYKFLDAAIDRVGQPYSIMQLVGIVLAKIFKLKRNPFGKRGYVCTELVAEILKEVNGLDFGKESNLIGLKDIFNILNNETI